MFTIHDSDRYSNRCQEHGEPKPCIRCAVDIEYEAAQSQAQRELEINIAKQEDQQMCDEQAAEMAYDTYQKLTEIFHETPKSPLASICRYLVTVHPVADILVALSDAFQNESNDILRSIYEENSQPTMGEAIDFSIVAQKVLRVQRELEVRK